MQKILKWFNHFGNLSDKKVPDYSRIVLTNANYRRSVTGWRLLNKPKQFAFLSQLDDEILVYCPLIFQDLFYFSLIKKYSHFGGNSYLLPGEVLYIWSVKKELPFLDHISKFIKSRLSFSCISLYITAKFAIIRK